MYQSVIKVCNDHVSVWEGIPGFVDAFTAFKNTYETVGVTAQQQASKTVGVSAGKYSKLNTLIDSIIVVHGTLKLHGKVINDPSLIARNKVNASMLKSMSMQQLLIHLDTLVADISNFGTSLGVYGIDEGTLDSALGTIDEARNVMNSPRNAIIERKFQTQRLDQYVKEMDDLLKFTLDTLVRVHKKSNPAFFDLYWNARVIIDSGVKKSNTPKEPD
jgi:hypothetical protein